MSSYLSLSMMMTVMSYLDTHDFDGFSHFESRPRSGSEFSYHFSECCIRHTSRTGLVSCLLLIHMPLFTAFICYASAARSSPTLS